MPAYLIFERETGQIVHVHIEPDEASTPREGLMAMVDPSHDPDALDVIVADLEQLREGIGGRVDPQTRETTPTADNEIGFAGGWAGPNRPHSLPHHARHQYIRVGDEKRSVI